MAIELVNSIDPPPRLTGDSGRDTVSVIQWLSSFYTKGILSGALLQTNNLNSNFASNYPGLASLAALVAAADQMAYFTGPDTLALTNLTDFARTFLDDADAAAVRLTIGAGDVVGPALATDNHVAVFDGVSGKVLKDGGAPAGDVVGPAGAIDGNVVLFDGVTGKLVKDGGALGTMSTQAANNVAITGGSVTGITDITVADGGTGRSTSTTAYGLIAAGTTATGAQQTLAAGATTEILVGGGAAALPVWTTATGTGAPVRAGAPTGTGDWTIPTINLTGGQIAFPAAQAASAGANTLDDYEEGTWSPEATQGITTLTYSLQEGYYTKIGRLVVAQGIFTLNGGTANASVLQLSLPITAKNGTTNSGTGGLYVGAAASSGDVMKFTVADNSAFVTVRAQTSTGTGSIAGTALGNAGQVTYSCSYVT